MLTCTKNPPASMKVITVTEARVVALFKSINVAPIASPSPCFAANYIWLYVVFLLWCYLNQQLQETYLSRHNAEEDCKHGQEEGTSTQFQSCHEIDNKKEQYWQYKVKWKVTCSPSHKICAQSVHVGCSFFTQHGSFLRECED